MLGRRRLPARYFTQRENVITREERASPRRIVIADLSCAVNGDVESTEIPLAGTIGSPESDGSAP